RCGRKSQVLFGAPRHQQQSENADALHASPSRSGCVLTPLGSSNVLAGGTKLNYCSDDAVPAGAAQVRGGSRTRIPPPGDDRTREKAPALLSRGPEWTHGRPPRGGPALVRGLYRRVDEDASPAAVRKGLSGARVGLEVQVSWRRFGGGAGNGRNDVSRRC